MFETKKDQKIKELEGEVENKERQNYQLQQRIEYLRKEKDLEIEGAKIKAKEEQLETEGLYSSLKVENEQLRERLEDSPYKQLEAILKALVVKLPTLDIKEITAKGKE